MGLILPQIVKTKVSSYTIKHYENLGYDLPKRKDKWRNHKNRDWSYATGEYFDVHVLDLSKGSDVKVKLICDCCHTVYETPYFEYIEHNHNGLIYCKNCCHTVLNTGENHPNWNPNLSDEERNNKRNLLPGYNNFAYKVIQRDKGICQCCNKKIEGAYAVHHLDSWDWCIEKRLDETNGILLCQKCHMSFHSVYGFGKNTKEQFMEWMGADGLETGSYYGMAPKEKLIYSLKYKKIFQIGEYCSLFHVNYDKARDVCNHKIKYIKKENRYVNNISVNKDNIFWLEEYEKMTDEDIKQFLDNIYLIENTTRKDALCLTTGVSYPSVKLAQRIIGVKTIGYCCRGQLVTAGHLPDGTRLKWMYLKDFEFLSSAEQLDIINSNINTIEQDSYLFNLYKELTKQAS